MLLPAASAPDPFLDPLGAIVPVGRPGPVEAAYRRLLVPPEEERIRDGLSLSPLADDPGTEVRQLGRVDPFALCSVHR
jgi:hypothetical protein